MVLIRRNESNRRKYTKATRLGLIVAVALILGAATSNPPAPSSGNTQTNHEKAATQKHYETQEAQSVSQSLTPLISQQSVGAGNIGPQTEKQGKWYANPDWWVAGFTGLLFIATTGLWWFTGKMWQATRDLTRLSIKRPWVFISGVHNLQIESAKGDEDREPLVTPRGRVFIEYAAVNHGEAPAIVEKVFCEFINLPEAFVPRVDQRDHPLMISPILGPSERVSIKEFLPQRMLRREGALLSNPQDEITTPSPNIPDDNELFFWIIVRYRGISSNGHETSALWRYEKNGGFTFMQIGGEERNYAK